MSRIKKLRSSRRSRGNNPARRNDDLPVPDGPNTTNSARQPGFAHPAQIVQTPAGFGRRAPKNTAASGSSSGSHPRYGARSGSCGWGPHKRLRRNPGPDDPLPQPRQALRAEPDRRTAVTDIDLGGRTLAVQIDALPFPGRVVTGQRRDRGAEHPFVQIVRELILDLAPGRRPPNSATTCRSPLHSGFPPAAGRPSTCCRLECHRASASRGRFRWPTADSAQSATAATRSLGDYRGWNGSKRYATRGHLSVVDCRRSLTGIPVGGIGGRTAPREPAIVRPGRPAPPGRRSPRWWALRGCR